jgi:phage shock protein A
VRADREAWDHAHMPNFFKRLGRYLNASANQKFDERADPRVQIEQAIQDAQRQHQALTQQAAAVLGNRRQLEMRLARQLSEIEQLQTSARQSLMLSQQAAAAGDAQRAAEFETAAQSFATQLVSAEASVEDLKSLHEQSVQASEQAKQAVSDNEQRLRAQLAERTKLLTQLESAKMREQMNTALTNMSEIAPPGDTPTLTEVRDKIEKRYATALGQSELASSGVEARMLEVRKATMNAAASNRLDEIRASLAAPSTGPALTKGGAAGAVGGQSAAAAIGPGQQTPQASAPGSAPQPQAEAAPSAPPSAQPGAQPPAAPFPTAPPSSADGPPTG